MDLIVSSNGEARCIYSEDVDLSVIGKLQIQRGSHVEPTSEGQWMADLCPVDGPRLGPFANRSDALRAEVAWLKQYWLPPRGGEAFESE